MNISKPMLVIGTLMLTAFACAPALAQSGENSPAFATNERIGRGLNVGQGGQTRDKDFQIIKDAGFNSVRIFFNPFLVPKPNAGGGFNGNQTFTTEAHFEVMDQTVKQALSHGLVVDLVGGDFAPISFPGGADMSEAAVQQAQKRFLAAWKQTAEHYKDYSSDLVFELMNEPANVLGPDRLNQLYAQAITSIRLTNPKRTILAAPEVLAGAAIETLDTLMLPENDRNIIVVIHNYNPGNFSHQGVPYIAGSDAWVGTKWGETVADLFPLYNEFYQLKAWSMKNHRPITLNEFGAIGTADLASRVRYASMQTRMAELMGFSWQYFTYASPDDSFSSWGIYSQKTEKWEQPILDALIPSKGAPNRIGPGISAVGVRAMPAKPATQAPTP